MKDVRLRKRSPPRIRLEFDADRVRIHQARNDICGLLDVRVPGLVCGQEVGAGGEAFEPEGAFFIGRGGSALARNG